mgnify:CR=1 FL=1
MLTLGTLGVDILVFGPGLSRSRLHDAQAELLQAKGPSVSTSPPAGRHALGSVGELPALADRGGLVSRGGRAGSGQLPIAVDAGRSGRGRGGGAVGRRGRLGNLSFFSHVVRFELSHLLLETSTLGKSRPFVGGALGLESLFMSATRCTDMMRKGSRSAPRQLAWTLRPERERLNRWKQNTRGGTRSKGQIDGGERPRTRDKEEKKKKTNTYSLSEVQRLMSVLTLHAVCALVGLLDLGVAVGRAESGRLRRRRPDRSGGHDQRNVKIGLQPVKSIAGRAVSV